MSKRQRFVISSIVLGSLMVAGNLALIEWRYWIIATLSIMCGVMTAWSIREGWRGVARWTTVLLPMLFGLGAGMFTFLLPDVVPGLLVWNWGVEVGIWVAWGLKIFFWLLFTVSIYFLVSTENIFSVSIIRSIPLVRTAYTSGFLYTLLTAFFVFNAIFSFRLPFYWNGLLVFGVSYPLLVQGLWSARLSDKVDTEILLASAVLALALAEGALVLSFWPVSVSVGSLAITTFLYVLLGIYQQYLQKRLFKNTIGEYVLVGIAVGLAVWLITKWG